MIRKLSIDFRHFRVFVFCHRADSKTRKPRKIIRSSFLEVLRLAIWFWALLGILCVQDATLKVLLKVANEHLLLFTIIYRYFLIRKLKRKYPYLLTLDKREEEQMDFYWNCLLEKFQLSQLVCTPCSKRCKIKLDAEEKLFVLTTFSRFIGLSKVGVM